jgi:hypothetical protein
VELLVPRSATAGLRCGSVGVGLRQHLCPHWVGGQPVLPPLSVQPTDRVAERMVLPAKDAGAPLPMVMGKRRAFQPSWGYRVARKDIRKL